MNRVMFLQGAAERGGAETILLALARHLPAVGIEPIVATLASGPFVTELEDAGVEVRRLRVAPRARQFWRTGDVVRHVVDAAVAVGASVVHSNGEKMALYGGAAARRLGVPSVVWLHDAPLRSASAAGLQVALATGRHAALVAPSEWMARSFRRRLGVAATTIAHGLDLDRLPTEPDDVRSNARWDEDTVVVGHFARLQRWKGGEVFLRAAAETARRRPDARFVVVGGALYGWEEEYASSLPALAHELGIADRVAFLGHRTDALSVMAACDVVAHASLRPEPLGLVVLEAMALGRAVVATRTGGPEELIEHGVTGMLVRPGDPTGLSDAIGELANDEGVRHRLGTAASRTVRERWSAERMAEQFAALYADVSIRGRGVARDA